MKPKLKFAKGNAKLGKNTAIFSLPAGHTCLGAKQCLSMANRITGKLTDGKDAIFRCYAATGENLFTNIRISRWRNYNLLKGKSICEMSELILRALPRKIKLCRLHASGDFFNQDYFDAWIKVAQKRPDIIFYGYTKALPLWVRRLDVVPKNLILVASLGGKYDNLIAKHWLRYARVVFSESEASNLSLPIDHDDTHCWNYDGNFALLLHGTQPASSEAGKVMYQLRKAGNNGYEADYFGHYAKSQSTVNA